MAFNVKRGRKSASIKMRSFEGITPKGFRYSHISRKDKAIVYKKA